MSESKSLKNSAVYLDAKRKLLEVIEGSARELRSIRPSSSSESREGYLKVIQNFQIQRGRDLYFPFLSSGMGSGPFVELEDGSVKLDLITAIGVNFFGHAHPKLMAEAIDALPANIWQGNLQPGTEAQRLIEALLARVGTKSNLKHAWLTTCGTMANEIALKIIRQKKAPATKVIAFKDCFAGRSTAMQEITDNESYRQGQPLYGEALYLPFYDTSVSLQENTTRTVSKLQEHIAQNPGKIAALMMELVQGEGGFGYGPREWYVSIFEVAKNAGLAIWLDEIQTFGRTGELFAYQKFDLDPYIDVVTIAKMLQASAVLFSDQYNPKPGLVAGTFSGPTSGLRAARRVLEILDEEKFLGPQGKISKMSERFVKNLENLKSSQSRGMIGEIRAIGGMIGFVPFDGKMEQVKAVLTHLFDLGVVAFYCGHGPYLIRLLPPLGAMTDAEIDLACLKMGEALKLAEATLLEKAK
jgi:acetylornithine/N-succinyldiaminopimelate aminotransferase